MKPPESLHLLQPPECEENHDGLGLTVRILPFKMHVNSSARMGILIPPPPRRIASRPRRIVIVTDM